MRVGYRQFLTMTLDKGFHPRLHGNGFIQLDLPNGDRLHIWHPALPRQNTSTQIHNHKFSFRSEVLCGKLTHIHYKLETNVEDFANGEIYNLYHPVVREKEDTVLELSNANAVFKFHPLQMLVLTEGSSYDFSYAEFHETKAQGFTATIVHKELVVKNFIPSVACRVGSVPDNDFGRYQFEEKELWKYVKMLFAQLYEINLRQ